MRRLFKGQLSDDEFKALLSLTKISSDSVKKSLSNYYVVGMSASNSLAGGMQKGHMTRAMKIMEAAAEKKAKLIGE